jgi:cell fate regulator YaaT (PSP1 superfamily)
MEVPVITEQPAASAPVQPAHRIVGVRFIPVGKIYHFDATRLPDVRVADWVIVTTARGKQMGQVASINPSKHNAADGPLKSIERLATNRDLALKKYYEVQEIAAMVLGREKTKALNLPLRIIKAEYTFDGQRLAFLFVVEEGNENVDVDPLRAELQTQFRAKVEMRLTGPRDAAKIIGGAGACGMTERCCAKFLTEFSPVSVKMAKEQGLSLNPSDITGMCGRLRCCLIYEYEQYVEARKLLPKRNKEVNTPLRTGRVLDVLPLKDSVIVLIGETVHEVTRENLQPVAELEALQKKVEEPCSGDHGCNCGVSRTTGSKKRKKNNRPPSSQKEPDHQSPTPQ